MLAFHQFCQSFCDTSTLRIKVLGSLGNDTKRMGGRNWLRNCNPFGRLFGNAFHGQISDAGIASERGKFAQRPGE
jgi:hypothetical protein